MDFTSLSIRIWKEQMEIIKKAAEKEGVSPPEYVRSKIMPHAFKDSGEAPREFPPFVRGRPTPASQVAAKLGMPRRQWERAIIDAAAAAAMKKIFDEEGEEEEPRARTHSTVRALAHAPVIRRKKA